MLGAIAMLREMISQAGIETGFSTFNFALTDGRTVVVTRYCDKAPHIPPPSLYFAFLPCETLRSRLNDSKADAPTGPAYGLSAGDKVLSPRLVKPGGRAGSDHVSQDCEGGAFICASEPLTRCPEQWTLIEVLTLALALTLTLTLTLTLAVTLALTLAVPLCQALHAASGHVAWAVLHALGASVSAGSLLWASWRRC